ncbi:MAG: hypothetical protein PVG39_02245 [Desulfobacteraceae bacterium]|jgi:hypothetical protein
MEKQTWKTGYEAFHNNHPRPTGAGSLMVQKGWDDAKFGYRQNGSHPDLDDFHYKGPGWTKLMEDNPAAAGQNAVKLGYAQ